MKTCKCLILLLFLLGVSAVVEAQDSYWTCDEHQYEYDMSAYLTLVDNSQKVLDMALYEVAAFVGEECRGVAELLTADNGQKYLYLRIRSNKKSGETVVFRCYSSLTKNTYAIEGTVEFVDRSHVGYPSMPHSLVKKDLYYNVNVDIAGKGSVSGGGTYIESDTAKLTAIPDEGWRFGHWNGGATDSVCSFVVDKDTVVTANFVINQYVVTFYDSDGKTIIKQESLDYGTTISVPDAPLKEGYTFMGWGEVAEKVPAMDVSYVAEYSVNRYLIRFVVDGQELLSDSLLYGAVIEYPDEPAKVGHTFDGWNKEVQIMPAEDIVITGSFTVNTYAITYIVDGKVFATDSVAYGTEIILCDEPVKEGHTFSGWSEVPETMPAEDITVEGSFTVNSYTVTFMIDGEIYKIVTVEYGAEIEIPVVVEKEGYIFNGWEDIPEMMPANDIIINGRYMVDTAIGEIIADFEKNEVYNLKGLRITDMNKLTHGIYIVNGKKVFVK